MNTHRFIYKDFDDGFDRYCNTVNDNLTDEFYNKNNDWLYEYDKQYNT